MTDLSKFAAPAGRVLLAFIFVLSGFQKLGDVAGNAAYIEMGGLPGFLIWPTIALEIIGGFALMAGIYARTAAVLLAGFTLVAGVLYHLIPAGSAEGMMAQFQMIMFMKNVSIAGGLLLVLAMGPGAYSVKAGDGRLVAA